MSREALLQMWEAGDKASQQSSTDTVLEDASTRGASATTSVPLPTPPGSTTSALSSSPSTPLTSMPPPPAICHGQVGHRPRISVSSTSSGSSGHASIWSMGSMNSNTSMATHYSQSALTPPSSQSSPHQSVPQHSIGVTSGLPQVSSTQVSSSQGWGPGRFNYYWCTSCETRFKRKYDWKRHEEEFHERWKKYPCPEPGCNRSFWGANTFNQHHKSSHGCKTCPHSEKVVKYLKRRKYWACGFCSALHPSRERHVEHVARHFESGKTKSDWMHSRVIYGLLHQPLIHDAWKDLLMSKAAEFAGRQPNFSWNPTQTGRAQGFMENECSGQLQDLLEFFSGPSAEAESIVAVAYELADLVFLNVPASPPMDYTQCYPPPPTALAPPPQSQSQTQTQQQQPQSHQSQQQQQQQPPQQQAQAYSPQPMLPPSAIPSQTLSAQQSPTPVVPSQQQPDGSHQQSFIEQVKGQQPQMDQMGNQHQQMGQQQLMPPPMFHSSTPTSPHSNAPLQRSSLDRDLPPPPQETSPMHFNYMSNNGGVVFENWQAFGNPVVDQQSQTPTGATVSTEWPMMPVQYYHTS